MFEGGYFVVRVLAVIFFSILSSVSAVAQDLARYSVLQGVTDSSNVQFTIVHRRGEPLQFFARNDAAGELYEPDSVQIIERDFSVFVVSRIKFKNLPNLMTGSLILEDSSGKLLEARPFKLLDLAKREVRMALVSCAAGYLYESEIWQQLNQSDPEFVLFIGDNVYADRPNLVTKKPADPKQLWEQYVNARQRYDFFFRRELVPALATWDDHDFGKDDGDMHFEHAEASRQVFSEFWAQDEGVSSAFKRGPGISSAFQGFGVQFALLDDRSFRTGEREADPTGWGAPQKEWFDSLTKQGTEPMIVVNGEQFFGAYRGKYSVESSFPQDLTWLLTSIKSSGRAAGFISGDVHYSEFMELESALNGQLSVEITSSSLHSVTFPGQHNRYTNPRRRAATSAHNFILLELHAEGTTLIGQAASVAVDGRFLFNRNLQIGGVERIIPRTPGLKVLPVPSQMIRDESKFEQRATPFKWI